MDERRIHTRHSIESLVVLEANTESVNGFLRNISYGGCYFIAFDAIPNFVNDVNIILNKPGVFNYTLQGEIVRRNSQVRSSKKYYEYGIEFSNPDFNKEKIQTFLDEILK